MHSSSHARADVLTRALLRGVLPEPGGVGAGVGGRGVSITLRPDQERMWAETTAALRAGHRGVLNVSPTGSGKGDLISHTMGECVRWERRAAMVVHLQEIVLDVRARIVARGLPEPRVLLGSHAEGPSDAPLTVASWQTLAARDLDLDVHVLLADEAHRSKTATAARVLSRNERARLLGFTATAARSDGSGLGPVGYTALIQGPQVRELVDAGHLAPVSVVAPDEATDALAWDPVDAWVRWAPMGAAGIVFASSLAHSHALADALRAAGVHAMHVDADTPRAARAWAVGALDSGELDVLCCFRLFIEGVNVRRAAVAVLASAFSHAGPYLQAVGRVRRTHPTKPRALVLDLRGSLHRLGHPDEDRTYHLEGAGVRRAPAAGLTPVSQCPAPCFAWGAPGRPCELCGATRPPPKAPRVSKRELREQRLARQPREGAAWDLWVRLVIASRERGWKPQAAALRFRAETGAWPRWSQECVPAASAQEGGERGAA